MPTLPQLVELKDEIHLMVISDCLDRQKALAQKHANERDQVVQRQTQELGILASDAFNRTVRIAKSCGVEVKEKGQIRAILDHKDGPRLEIEYPEEAPSA